MGEIAALLREIAELREETAIPANQIEAGQEDREQSGGKEGVHLALHPIVNRANLRGGLLLVLIVLHQQARNGGAERGLTRLERKTNLGSGFGLLSITRDGKGAVDRIPKLRERLLKIYGLLRITFGHAELIFDLQCAGEVGADALELSLPGDQRVGLVVVEHVPHGEAQGIQVILNPEKLERIAAIMLDQIVLQFAQRGNLPGDVPGISHDGGDGDDQPEK